MTVLSQTVMSHYAGSVTAVRNRFWKKNNCALPNQKRLVEDAKQEHTANSSDNVENYRFLVVGRGQRKKVIKIKRKPSSA